MTAYFSAAQALLKQKQTKNAAVNVNILSLSIVLNPVYPSDNILTIKPY